jgi:hypothetical protein
VSPGPHPTKSLRDLDTTKFLEELRILRQTTGLLETQLRRQSVHRAALATFRAEIDEMAGLLTGDRTYFHGKPHAG